MLVLTSTASSIALCFISLGLGALYISMKSALNKQACTTFFSALALTSTASSITLRFISLGPGALYRSIKAFLRKQACTLCFYTSVQCLLVSILKRLHILHISYYHQGDLEGNCILKYTKVKSCALLQLIQTVYKSISMDK